MRTCFLIAAAIACLSACSPAAAPDAGELTPHSEFTLEGFRHRYGFAGATAAIALPDGAVSTLGPLEWTRTFPPDRRVLPGLAVCYTIPENPFGLPVRTADAEGRLVWDPRVEWTGGGLASTARDLALWGHALFSGSDLVPALEAPLADLAMAAAR